MNEPVTRRGAMTLLGAGFGGGAVFGLALKELLADQNLAAAGAQFNSGSGEVAIEEDGAHGIGSLTGSTHWSDRPPMRLRISRDKPDSLGGQHFLALPYEFGMALEYPGIVECWTQQWSIHNYTRNNDRGAELWVGNHDDSGGLRLTGYHKNGSRYGMIAADLFEPGSGGDLRLVVRDRKDAVEVRSGAGDAERPLFRVSERDGLEVSSDGGPAFHVSPSGDLRANGRVVAAGGLAVGTAERNADVGPVRQRVPLHNEHGKLLGYIPVHEAP